jgi:hypothetical protein
MTEAPDPYPDFPDDEDDSSVEDDGVEGRADQLHEGPQDAYSEAVADQVRTGDARVDDVLASLAELDDRPVRGHAAVFEQAHERLRAALDPDHQPARESA